MFQYVIINDIYSMDNHGEAFKSLYDRNRKLAGTYNWNRTDWIME